MRGKIVMAMFEEFGIAKCGHKVIRNFEGKQNKHRYIFRALQTMVKMYSITDSLFDIGFVEYLRLLIFIFL